MPGLLRARRRLRSRLADAPRRERDGDHYVVNGQKTWTTLAQYADWIFCLVRTDPAAKKQEGISFLLIDMKTPGITVRPIQTIDGGYEVNEVFFDDVKVPAENLVGEENKGWNYAKFLLGNERTGIARVGISKSRIRRLKELAALEQAGGKPLLADERFRAKIARAPPASSGGGARLGDADAGDGALVAEQELGVFPALVLLADQF